MGDGFGEAGEERLHLLGIFFDLAAVLVFFFFHFRDVIRRWFKRRSAILFLSSFSSSSLRVVIIIVIAVRIRIRIIIVVGIII